VTSGTHELWDDPQESEQRLRLAAQEATGADQLSLRTLVARAVGLQQRYAEAHKELDAVESARRRLPRIDKRTALTLHARVNLERGRLHRSAGDPDRAAEYFEDAVRLAREADETILGVDAVHMLALVERSPQFAVRLHRQALTMARACEDPVVRGWRAAVLNNLGCSLVEAGRPDEALEAFDEALELRVRADPEGCQRETRTARAMVAWALRLLGRTDDALVLQRQLKEELAAAGDHDPFVEEELALLENR
jgi:tetratricopeptide (TPR) repeat protein